MRKSIIIESITKYLSEFSQLIAKYQFVLLKIKTFFWAIETQKKSDEAIINSRFYIDGLSTFVVTLNVSYEEPYLHSVKDAADPKNGHILTKHSQTSFKSAKARRSETLAVIESSAEHALAAF